jgi:tetratricopeptide (TPR) repeat protein
MAYQSKLDSKARGRSLFAGGGRRRLWTRAALVTCAGVALAGCVTTTSKDPNFGKTPATPSASTPDETGFGASITKSFKAGTDKVSAAFKPKPEPTEHVTEKPWYWWPFDKKDEGPGADFFVSLARVHEQTGSYDRAIEQYNKALAIDPDFAPALVGYAHVLDRQGQKVKATEYYVRAFKAHPEDASVANDLGLCFARQGKFDQAIEYLDKAVKLQPDRELYRNNIATVLVEVGRVDQAVKQIAAVYGDPIAHYNVGVLLTQRGKQQAAVEQFTAAVQQDPGLTEARDWLDQLTAEEEPREQLASAQLAEPASAESVKAITAQAPTDPTPPMKDISTARVASRPAAVTRMTSAPTVASNSLGAAPAVPPSPDQFQGQATVVTATDLPASAPTTVRPLPAIDSGYVPPSRY